VTKYANITAIYLAGISRKDEKNNIGVSWSTVCRSFDNITKCTSTFHTILP